MDSENSTEKPKKAIKKKYEADICINFILLFSAEQGLSERSEVSEATDSVAERYVIANSCLSAPSGNKHKVAMEKGNAYHFLFRCN